MSKAQLLNGDVHREILYNIDGTCSENRVPKEKMKELMKMLIDFLEKF